jgi:hypothetical protein
LYAKLLRFYPKLYYERFGESMEQTFNDLCREREEVGDGLFGFVLWVFADTLVEIIKEGIKFMTPTVKKNGTLIMSVIAAITMLATAYLVKGSEYENTFFYVFAIGLVLFAAFEVTRPLRAVLLAEFTQVRPAVKAGVVPVVEVQPHGDLVAKLR